MRQPSQPTSIWIAPKNSLFSRTPPVAVSGHLYYFLIWVILQYATTHNHSQPSTTTQKATHNYSQPPTSVRNHSQPLTTVHNHLQPPAAIHDHPKTTHNHPQPPPPHNHPQPSTTMHNYLKTTQKSENLSETVMSLHFRCSY